MKDSNVNLIKDLIKVIGKKFLITNKWNQQPYCKGWRYRQGDTLAVTLPGTLLEMWDLLEICVSNDLIIIMQGANTGLTGGSTPFGSDYDRPIIIINTIRIKDIHLIKNGKHPLHYFS